MPSKESITGITGTSNSLLFPLVSFTIFSPMIFKTLYSSSVLGFISNNCGLSAMKLVSHCPLLKVSLFNTFIRKTILVLTPVIFNSLIERMDFLIVSSKVLE